MATPSDSFKRLKAFFHALSKTNTEASQYVFESQYKSAHSVRSQDVWADTVGYALDVTAADSFTNANPEIVKKYVQYSLTEISGSNGQGYYLDVDGKFVNPWISPVDIPHETTAFPSLGYEAKLYQEDGTFITPTQGVFVVDYYAGIVLFQEGYTPSDMGWGTPKITCYTYIGKKGSSSSSSTIIDLNYGRINSHSATINNGETKDIATFIPNYRTVEFLISVTDGENETFYSSKIISQHDDINALYNEYAILGNCSLKLSVIFEDDYLKLKGTATGDNQQIKAISHGVDVSETFSSSSSSSSSST